MRRSVLMAMCVGVVACAAWPGAASAAAGSDPTLTQQGPAPFDLLAPAAKSQNVAPQPTFAWSQTTDSDSGIDYYVLWVDGKTQIVPTTACSARVCQAQIQTALAQGSHTWLVKAVSGAGLVRESNKRWTLTVDATPPPAFDLGIPVNGERDVGSRPTFFWGYMPDSGSSLDHYELWVDGAELQSIPLSACSGHWCWASAQTPLAAGPHTWLVKAVDDAGNVRTSTETWSFTVAPASYSLYATREALSPVTGAAAMALPAAYVIPPGFYRVGGATYDMRREGFYELPGGRRIVYSHTVEALISALSWSMDGHANLDARLPFPTQEAIAEQRALILNCGEQVEFARYVLGQFGIHARAVATLFRLNAGHTVMEVSLGGRWVLFDPYYQMQPLVNGRPTTIVQWTSLKQHTDGKVLATSSHLSWPGPGVDSPKYDAIWDLPLISSSRQTWPYYFTDPDDATLGPPQQIEAAQPGYRYLSPAAFADLYSPGAFNLLSPANGARNLAPQPTFSWAPTTDVDAGVDHYELWVDGRELQDVRVPGCSAGVCQIQPQRALAQGSHTWLVRAVSAAGIVRVSNQTRSFTVGATPPAKTG